MFCPQCRSEFRDGFFRCADCDLDLVAELQPEPKPEYIPFQQILATFNPADIAIIKSILDTEQIRYYFLGEHFGYIQPLADPARLMVAVDQADIARQILEDLQLSYSGLNIHSIKNENER